ncbi:MAG: hypothetical protein K0U74_14130 [Alphaproteobacteria bacterium]|nr:hypothetical protein [Alphaproteobacteria bacterium]
MSSFPKAHRDDSLPRIRKAQRFHFLFARRLPGAETAKLEGHTRTVTSAVFSPDGDTVLTASGDATARLWDARTGKETARLEGHTS